MRVRLDLKIPMRDGVGLYATLYRRDRFRASYEDPTLIEPSKVYQFQIQIWETSNLFRKGHRIRLEVSSSNFPRFDRNLNTGDDPATDTGIQVAEQKIHHDPHYPSHSTLSVIPR